MLIVTQIWHVYAEVKFDVVTVVVFVVFFRVPFLLAGVTAGEC